MFKFFRYVIKGGSVVAAPRNSSGAGRKAKLAFLFVLVLLLGSSVLTAAQPAASAAAGSQATMNAADAFAKVGTSIVSGLNALRGGQGGNSVMGLGMKLFGLFLLMNVVWSLIKGMITGSGLNGFFSDFVPDLVAAAVVLVFLTQDFGGAIEKGLDGLASVVTGVPNSNTASLVNTAGQQGLQTLSNIFNVPSVSITNLSWSAIFSIVPTMLYGLIAKGIALLCLILALCLYIGTLVTSQVSVIIALILAPFFIPFLMFKPGSFLFDGWLRFFLGAGMMKIVGVLMLTVTSVMMGSLVSVSESAIASGTSGLEANKIDMVIYGSMILLSALSAMMMLSVPGIAAGLIGGSGGGAGFGGFSHLVRSPANKLLLGGMGSKSGGGGPPGLGGSKAGNSLSGLTNLMPNIAKPVTHLAGAGLSKTGGFIVAGKDMKASNISLREGTGSEISRDLSKMSATSAKTYISRLEKANANRPMNYGPPTPPYTVSKPVSSTTPVKS